MRGSTLSLYLTDYGLTLDDQVVLGRLSQFVLKMKRADAVMLMHGEDVVFVPADDGVATVVLESSHRRQNFDDAGFGLCLLQLQLEDDGSVLVGQVLVEV
jgi:hypothetical protein